MRIVESTVSAGDREIFELDAFLARPLYAHLAHNSLAGPRDSPVWFHWDGHAFWIIGGVSFPANLKLDSRCALKHRGLGHEFGAEPACRGAWRR